MQEGSVLKVLLHHAGQVETDFLASSILGPPDSPHRGKSCGGGAITATSIWGVPQLCVYSSVQRQRHRASARCPVEVAGAGCNPALIANHCYWSTWTAACACSTRSGRLSGRRGWSSSSCRPHLALATRRSGTVPCRQLCGSR